MMKELMKKGDRSLILWEHGDTFEYVVCSYYDKDKPEGECWCWGHYFGHMLPEAVEYINGNALADEYKEKYTKWRNIADHILFYYEQCKEQEWIVKNLGLSYEDWEELGYSREFVDQYLDEEEETE